MPSNDHNEREIFGRLNGIDKTLARIDERTERMDREWHDSRADHETRIRKLEQESAKRRGVIAALSSIGGVVGAAIMWLLSHLFGGGKLK